MARRYNNHRGLPRPEQKAFQVVRCAIYTRKSTTEGLDSDFNTLDAQREACEAYILSQRLEGWLPVPQQYDDGGFTGGNIDRPALTRLLEDVEAGQIDCVVVYKVDRLSRSLLDFARLMEVFDLHQVAFVSITQQFNTATSMGRLVLNVLLSFAQFEREIISERTADKMGAARRKGKLLGGRPVLGYNRDHERKRLVLNAQEVPMVKEIFRLYLELQSMLDVAQEVNRRGWTTKSHVTLSGKTLAGRPFDKTRIGAILTNIEYTGRISFKGEIVPGEQPAIIEPELFEQVQKRIRSNRHKGCKELRHKHIALLKRLLMCGTCGKAMGHTYAKKGSRLYRYYLCTTRHKRGEDGCASAPLPAQQIEDHVVEMIRRIGQDPQLRQEAFAQTVTRRHEERTRLEHEQAQAQGKVKDAEHEVARLVAAIGSAPNPSAALIRELNEREDALRIQRNDLAQLGTQLTELQSRTANGKYLLEALSRFDLLWDALGDRERIELLRQIADRIVYHPATHQVSISFRLGGSSAE